MSEKKGGGLVTDLKVGETILIGGAQVIIEEKSGQRVRLRIKADESIKIEKQNKPCARVYNKLENSNG